MRPSLRLIPLVAVAGLGLTGCGPSTTAPNVSVLVGKSSHDIVLAAAKDDSGSFRFTMAAKLTADTSGLKSVPPSLLQGFGPLGTGLTIDTRGEEESPARLTATVKLGGGAPSVVEVTYDGRAYISNDGGKHFVATGAPSEGSGGVDASPAGVKQVLDALPSVTDLGAATDNGAAVEHLRAPVDSTLIGRFLGGGDSGPVTPQAAEVARLLTVRAGTLDAYVRRDTGRLERVAVQASFAFDLGPLFTSLDRGATPAAAAPSGVVAYTLAYGSQFSDYGSSIVIARPPDAAAATASPAIGFGSPG